VNHNDTPPIAATAPALALVADLAAKYPQLPAPYLTFSTHERATTVGVQCPTLDAFEAWRDALNVDPAGVSLFASMISVDIPAVQVLGREVVMHLYAGGLASMAARPLSEWEVFVAAAVVESLNVDEDGPDDCISIPDDWRALRRQQEDPHDGPNHHSYSVAHDMPSIPHQQDRSAQ